MPDINVQMEEGTVFRRFPDKPIVIFEMTDNHIPDEMYRLSREQDVFYEDHREHKLVQIMDLREE